MNTIKDILEGFFIAVMGLFVGFAAVAFGLICCMIPFAIIGAGLALIVYLVKLVL